MVLGPLRGGYQQIDKEYITADSYASMLKMYSCRKAKNLHKYPQSACRAGHVVNVIHSEISNIAQTSL